MCVQFGLFDNDKLILEKSLDNGLTHSENFMPLVSEVLEETKTSLSDVDVLGITSGPGSFTGTRIGIASCKAIAEVHNIQVVPVSSLEVLAGNEKENSNVICSIIDARNNQVYSGIFDGKISKKEEFIADDINVVIDRLKNYDEIMFVGDGAILHRELIEECLSNKNISFSENNKQNAKSLGIITFEKARKGEFVTSDELMPVYLRKSQAERMKNK